MKILKWIVGIPIALFVGSAMISGAIEAIKNPRPEPTNPSAVHASPLPARQSVPENPQNSTPDDPDQQRTAILAYISDIHPIMDDFGQANKTAQMCLQEMVDNPALFNDNEWRLKLGVALATFEMLPDRLAKIKMIPSTVALSHGNFRDALNHARLFAIDYTRGIDKLDNASFLKGNKELRHAGNLMEEAAVQLRSETAPLMPDGYTPPTLAADNPGNN